MIIQLRLFDSFVNDINTYRACILESLQSTVVYSHREWLENASLNSCIRDHFGSFAVTPMIVMAIFDALTIPFQRRFMATLDNAASKGCNPKEKLGQDLQRITLQLHFAFWSTFWWICASIIHGISSIAWSMHTPVYTGINSCDNGNEEDSRRNG